MGADGETGVGRLPAIDDYVDAAVGIAAESGALLRVDDISRKIAGAIGAPEQMDQIAQALLEACIRQKVPVEMNHRESEGR